MPGEAEKGILKSFIGHIYLICSGFIIQMLNVVYIYREEKLSLPSVYQLCRPFPQTCCLEMRICFYSLWLHIHIVCQFTNAAILLGAENGREELCILCLAEQ